VQIPWDTVATVLTVVTSIGTLAYWLGRKFTEIDSRFKLIDERFKTIDERFRSIDERFKQIDKRFEQIEKRFEEIDSRFERIEERFREIDRRFDEFKKYVDTKFEDLRNYIDVRMEKMLKTIARATTHTHEVVIEYLGLKGLLEEKEVTYLRHRVREVLEAYTTATPNPLTKEELEFLKKLFSKDINEMTIEELDRAYEIGIRLFSKDMDDRGYFIAIAAITIKAYLKFKKKQDT